MGDQQAGERHAPALAGGEVGDRRHRRVRETDRAEGFRGRERGVAEKVASEGEVLLRRERRLQPVLVADEVEAFRQRPLSGPLPADRAGLDREPAGEDAEQRRLAGAVAAGDKERLPLAKGKRNSFEDAAARAAAGEVVDDQTHGRTSAEHAPQNRFEPCSGDG